MGVSTATASRTIRLESRDCTRCGGTGTHSYCTRFGTTCFKCSGSKVIPTVRAARAKAKLDAWATDHLSVAASQLRVGDRVLVSGDGGPRWRTVATVKVDLEPRYRGGGQTGAEGTEAYVAYSTLGNTTLTFERSKGAQMGAAHRPVRRAGTPEQVDAYYAYAATLPGVTVVEG